MAILALAWQWRFVFWTIPLWGPFLLPLLLATDTGRMLSLFFPVAIPMAASLVAMRGRIVHTVTLMSTALVGATFYWTVPLKSVVVLCLVSLPPVFVLFGVYRASLSPGNPLCRLRVPVFPFCQPAQRR